MLIVFILTIVGYIIFKLSSLNKTILNNNQKNQPEDKNTIFYDENGIDVGFSDIKYSISQLFNKFDEDSANLFDVNYIGTVSDNYEDGNKKITMTKNIHDCSINIYYENGNPMYEYNRSKHSTIDFSQYSSDDKTIFSRTYKLDEFLNLLRALPNNNNTTPHDIVLLYRILATSNLNDFIMKNNDQIIFYDKNNNEITLRDIKEDILYRVFLNCEFKEESGKDIEEYFDEFDIIFDKNYTGIVSSLHENGNKKVTITKNISHCNIHIYYEDSTPMFEYTRPDSSSILFSQYSLDGKLVSSKNYSLDEFSVLLESLPPSNTTPKDIMLLYKILDTSHLDALVDSMQEHILFYHEDGDCTTLSDIFQDLYIVLGENEYKFNNLTDENCRITVSASYDNGKTKISLLNSTNSYKIDVYYENGNQMFEYHSSNNSVITFSQYYSNGEIISSEDYKFGDFSDLVKFLPKKNIIPEDILFLYKILGINSLNYYISANNNYIIFSDRDYGYVTLPHIEENFYLLLDKNKDSLNKIFNKTHVEVISNSYGNGNKKIIVDKNMDDHNISIYYENENPMFEYLKPDNSTILFNQYSFESDIISAKTYAFDDFADFLKAIPVDNTIPNDILLLYKILDTYDLNRLIRINNNHIITAPLKQNIKKFKGENIKY